MPFQKATKKQSKARVGFAGPAGSGKSLTALKFARQLVGADGKIAAVDSEHGSLAKYADVISFDVQNMVDHNPANYVRAIKEAEDAGYDAIVIDSLSHAWIGQGGALDIVDKEGDKFNKGWKKVSPLQQKLIDAILGSRIHVIATMRSKMAYESTKDSNGKTQIQKLGLQPIQREGMEYEFDMMLDLAQDTGTATVSKCRAYGLIEVGETARRDGQAELFGRFIRWLESGEKDTAQEDAKKAILSLLPLADFDGLQSIADRVQSAGLTNDVEVRAAYKARKQELDNAKSTGSAGSN